MTTLIAAFALIAQPYIGVIASQSAQAASLVLTPTTHSIEGGQTKVSTVNASTFTNMTLSFTHAAENLEPNGNDTLKYGWRVNGGLDNQLGVIEGKPNVGNMPGVGENSTKTFTLPATAAVSNLEIYFTNTGGNNDTVSISDIAISGDELPVTPQLTHIDPYYVLSSYKGIGVDFKVSNLTDVTSIEIKVDRTNGGPVVKTAKESVINNLNSGGLGATAPIVIQQGTYNEAGSDSWNQPISTWDHTTIPTSVTVTITRSGGVPLVMTKALVENMGPFATRSQVMSATPVNSGPAVNFMIPTPNENSYVRGIITPHVTASDDYGMGSYYVRVWKNAFESGVSNLVYNGCSSAPGAALLGTAQDVTCPVLNTTTLTDGKYVLSAQFLDSDNVWGQALRTFYVDNTAPTITVKAAPDTVGSTASKTFSKVSFKLHDNIKFEGKYTINGVESAITPTTWGDANSITVGQRGAVYGENTITLKDLAGNSASYTFTLDNLAPTIKIKDGFVGSKEANTFSNVSFSLFDAHQVDKYTINGHTSDFGNNNWSDANFQNIKQYLNQGLNTFVLYDVAGNKSTFEFTYDTTAPGASFTHSNNNDNTLVNTNVISTLHATEPIQTPAGWTLVADSDNKMFTKISTENNKGNIVITDFAGNSSTVFFEVKRIDKIAPVFNISNGDVFTTPGVDVIVTEVNLANTIKVDGVDTAYTGTKPNYKVSVTGEGTHTVTATDKAGNATTVTFTIDSTAPSISWQLQPKNIYGIGQGFNIRPITSEVGTIKSVYIDSVNSANLVRTLASDHKNFDTSNAHNQTLWDSLSDGIHKFIAVFEDYAGNVTTSESSSFTIDRTAPDGSFTFSNNKAPTKGNVYAYLTTTEPVTISPTGSHGWEATDATHFKHKFTNNGSFDAVITDAAGNSKTLTASVDWIDRTAPSVTQYAYSNNGNLTKNDVTVTITTSEPVDTPTDWNRVDDTHFTRVFEHNGGFTVSLTDKVGNTATVGGKSQGAEVKGIDKNAPIISGITEGAIVSNAVQLSVFDPKYEGADGFNANTGLNVDGDWVVTTPGANKTYLYEVTGEGLHTVFATDKAGNVTDTLHFTIDTTPPEMTLNAIATSTSTSRTITGTGDAGETVEVTVHSTPQTKTTTVDQMGVWSVTFDNLEVGLHTVKATIFDALGNRSEEVIGSFKVLAVTVPTETDPETNNPDTNNASDTPTTAGANAAGTPSQASNLAGLGLAVLGVSTTANEVAQAQSPAEEESDVKGTSTAGSDTDTNKQSEAGCGTFLGICWYYWIPVVIAAIIAVYYLFRPRREEA
jgi:hypothetical protein